MNMIESTGTASRLVILLHGIGGSGASMMPFAAAWRPSLSNTRFAAPDAPYGYGAGHQWFGVDGQELHPQRIEAVRDSFDKLIGDLVRREGFESRLSRIAFVGISQGAIVALDAVASGRWPVGALVSFAGLLSPTPVASTASSTPVLLVHGGADKTIPAAASVAAAQRLRAAGFTVSLDVQPGIGHTVSMAGAQEALDFLKRVLA